MKKYSFFLFILVVGNVYPQNMPKFFTDSDNYSYLSKDGRIFTFREDGKMEIRNEGEYNEYFKRGDYNLIEENGINYLSVVWDDNTQDKYLILIQPHFYFDGKILSFSLYNQNGYPFFNMAALTNTYRTKYGHLLIDTKIISASSTLIEGSTVYSTDNLDERIGVCWAVKGKGIGEKIIFKNYEGKGYASLYISIGFVSFDKPYLYRQNSRPKKIKISYDNITEIIELEDTPNLQFLTNCWPKSNINEIHIEILEVYPGTKYNDTCINFLGWDWSQ
jgi:hypothetical protein